MLVEARYVVGAGKDDDRDLVDAGGLKDVVGALDIGLHDHLVVARARIAPLDDGDAEVDDGVDAFASLDHVLEVGEVGDHDFVVWFDLGNVAVEEQAEVVAVFEMAAQARPDFASRAGDEKFLFHVSFLCLDASVGLRSIL